MPVTFDVIRPHVGVFTFDNGKLNVLTPQMHRELFEHLERFNADPDIHVGIIKGSDGKSFSGGDDLKSERPKRSKREQLDAHLFAGHALKHGTEEHWTQQIMLMPRHKPIIAAADGWCLGQGMIFFLLLSDLRICTAEARFGLPEIAYGYAGGGGLTRLGRQVPHTTALWMLLTGEPLDAEEAWRAFLVNKVVPKEELMPTVLRLAERIAALPPAAVRIEMEGYFRGMDMSREDAIRYVSQLYRLQILGDVPDGIVPPFLQKKKAGRPA